METKFAGFEPYCFGEWFEIEKFGLYPLFSPTIGDRATKFDLFCFPIEGNGRTNEFLCMIFQSSGSCI